MATLKTGIEENQMPLVWIRWSMGLFEVELQKYTAAKLQLRSHNTQVVKTSFRVELCRNRQEDES